MVEVVRERRDFEDLRSLAEDNLACLTLYIDFIFAWAPS